MRELRRTRSGPFWEKDAVTLHEVNDAAYFYFEEKNPEPLQKIIQPIEDAMVHLPYIVVRDSAVDAICHGASLTVPGVVKLTSKISNGSLIVIKSIKGEAIALAKSFTNTKDILEMSHGIIAKTDRVLMEPGVYPPLWKKEWTFLVF